AAKFTWPSVATGRRVDGNAATETLGARAATARARDEPPPANGSERGELSSRHAGLSRSRERYRREASMRCPTEIESWAVRAMFDLSSSYCDLPSPVITDPAAPASVPIPPTISLPQLPIWPR